MQKLREEEEKERTRKDRLHQNYLKRKANGKQKEYEDRYKEQRIKIWDKKKEILPKNYHLAKDEIGKRERIELKQREYVEEYKIKENNYYMPWLVIIVMVLY